MKPIIASGLPAEVGTELWGMGLQYLSLSDLLRSNLARSFGMSVLLVLAVAVISFARCATACWPSCPWCRA